MNATTQLTCCVQCKAASGELGTFIADANRNLVSPIFDGLAGLLPWMNQNGFEFVSSASWEVRRTPAQVELERLLTV